MIKTNASTESATAVYIWSLSTSSSVVSWAINDSLQWFPHLAVTSTTSCNRCWYSLSAEFIPCSIVNYPNGVQNAVRKLLDSFTSIPCIKFWENFALNNLRIISLIIGIGNLAHQIALLKSPLSMHILSFPGLQLHDYWSSLLAPWFWQ